MHVLMHRRLELHRPIIGRVAKAQQSGMEGLSADDRRLPLKIAPSACGDDVRNGQVAPPVHVIAHDGMPQVRQVDSDLVRSSRPQFQFDQGEPFVPLPDPVDRHGLLSCLIPSDGVPLTDGRVTSEGEVDDIGERLHLAMDDGEVPLGGLAIFELLTDPPVGHVRLGEDHDSGGVPIESVDDAWSSVFPADIREAVARCSAVLKPPRQCIDHRAGSVGASRMNDDVVVLVDHDDVIILMDDGECDLLSDDVTAGRRRKNDGDDITSAESGGSLGMPTVDGHGAFADQRLKRRPAQERDPVAEVMVEPLGKITGECERRRDRRVIIIQSSFIEPLKRGRVDLSTGIEQCGVAI